MLPVPADNAVVCGEIRITNSCHKCPALEGRRQFVQLMDSLSGKRRRELNPDAAGDEHQKVARR